MISISLSIKFFPTCTYLICWTLQNGRYRPYRKIIIIIIIIIIKDWKETYPSCLQQATGSSSVLWGPMWIFQVDSSNNKKGYSMEESQKFYQPNTKSHFKRGYHRIPPQSLAIWDHLASVIPTDSWTKLPIFRCDRNEHPRSATNSHQSHLIGGRSHKLKVLI